MNTIKITNNTMISWSVMLGVNPGYDSTAHLTPESALQKAMPLIRYHLLKPGYTKLRAVEPAIAVYNRAWGCPDGRRSWRCHKRRHISLIYKKKP